jgi:hypothetical protein
MKKNQSKAISGQNTVCYNFKLQDIDALDKGKTSVTAGAA